MKRIVLTASVMSIFILGASAQQPPSMTRNVGKTTFGIHAGANMYNITGKDGSGTDLSNDLNTGFAAGVNAEIPLGSGSYIQPGIDFRQKGAEWSNGTKTTLNYVEIPVNFIYKPILGTGNFVLGVGPYLGFGIGGKATSANGTEQDIEFKDEFDITLNAVQFRKTDAGANFLVGYEFANKLSLNLKAQLGLKEINPDMGTANDQTSYKNTGFGLALGYRF